MGRVTEVGWCDDTRARPECWVRRESEALSSWAADSRSSGGHAMLPLLRQRRLSEAAEPEMSIIWSAEGCGCSAESQSSPQTITNSA